MELFLIDPKTNTTNCKKITLIHFVVILFVSHLCCLFGISTDTVKGNQGTVFIKHKVTQSLREKGAEGSD